jgi:hypothetical protein
VAVERSPAAAEVQERKGRRTSIASRPDTTPVPTTRISRVSTRVETGRIRSVGAGVADENGSRLRTNRSRSGQTPTGQAEGATWYDDPALTMSWRSSAANRVPAPGVWSVTSRRNRSGALNQTLIVS